MVVEVLMGEEGFPGDPSPLVLKMLEGDSLLLVGEEGRVLVRLPSPEPRRDPFASIVDPRCLPGN